MKQTPNYNLPQFDGEDLFNKEDFNDAFSKIDTAVSDLQETFNTTASGGVLTIQEVINARKGKPTLVEKIDEIDNNIVNVNEQIDEIDNNIVNVNEQLEHITFNQEGMRATVEYIQNNKVPVIENELTNLSNKVPIIENGLTNLSNNFISSNASKSIYQDYRFISTSFNQEEMKLVVLLSMDGINWDVVKKEGSYTPNTGNKTLRDPSLIKVSEWWYITYTKIDWRTGNNIGFCRTKDFVEYEELNDLTFGTYNKIWAPEFFRDYKTNNSYVIFNASNDGITFHSYIQQVWFNDNIVEKIGTHIQLQGNELSSMNTIDASLFQDNDRYYLTVKDETNKVNAIFESFNLTNDYKLIKTNLFPNHEGVQIIKLDNGGFRIYMDNYENRTIGLGFVDTYDCFNSFTPFKKIITEDFSGAHNFVVDTKQVAKTEQFDKSFIIANRTTDFVVPSNTDTTLPFNNISNKGDFDLSSDGNRALIGSNGVFLISVNVTWDSKDDTNERVVELRKYDINSDSIINLGKYHNNNLPNIYYSQSYTSLVYCNRGDQIFVNVYQAGGSECKIKALDYATSLKIVKII